MGLLGLGRYVQINECFSKDDGKCHFTQAPRTSPHLDLSNTNTVCLATIVHFTRPAAAEILHGTATATRCAGYAGCHVGERCYCPFGGLVELDWKKTHTGHDLNNLVHGNCKVYSNRRRRGQHGKGGYRLDAGGLCSEGAVSRTHEQSRRVSSVARPSSLAARWHSGGAGEYVSLIPETSSDTLESR